MNIVTGFCLLLLLAGGGVRGRVIDGITKEPLARVSVEAGEQKTITDPQGQFALETEAAELAISTVGYRPVRVPAAAEMEILLFPTTLRHRESMTVEAGAFGAEAPLAVAIEGNELKNLASVLADDPLRAAQALPGVTSNDDFTSQFSIRGAGYDRIGLYLDGILMHQPFHEVQGESTSGSLTILNGDLLDGMNLFASALPPRLGDRTAGALDVRSRDGDAQNFHARLSVGSSSVGGIVEGPWQHGSWIASVRQSYLQYLIGRVSDDPSLAFGFTDGQGRVRYDFTTRDALFLSVISGHSGLNRDSYIPKAGLNTLIFTDYDFTVASLSWRSAPTPSLTVTNQAAFLRERFTNRNRDSSPLGGSGYGEWSWNGNAAWGMRSSGLLEFGGTVRRLRDDGFIYRYVFSPAQVRPLDRFRGAGMRGGAYLQASRSFGAGRWTVTGGGRTDRDQIDGVTSPSPYASLAVQVTGSTRASLAWSQAVQYPEISQYYSLFGRTSLLPERSTHALLAVEQRIGERSRLRVEGYNRQDRDLLFRPSIEPRLQNGMVVNSQADTPWSNDVRGWARGVQVFLQHRTANGFNGWVSYAYGRTQGWHGPLDFDQRHTVQFYGSYRLRPSVNLSARYLYGSGIPVDGWYRGAMKALYLAETRNNFRLPRYQRADARLNKSWQRGRSRWTLYFEVVNLTNARNYRAEDISGYDSRTGSVRLNFTKMFPILPVAGLLVEL